MKVALLKCPDYDEERVFTAVKKGVELIDRIDALKGKTLLKPNLLGYYHSDRGITTHPAIVKAIAKLTKSIGGRPVIADSPGSGIPYTKESLKKLYQITGMEGLGADLNYDTEFKGFFSEDKGFRLIKLMGEVDSVVNIPKLKTHSYTILSCGVKNLFGLIPGFDKLGYHSTLPDVKDFSSMLFRLADVVQPKLTIVDGIVGMEGDGPSGGILRDIGWIIVSDNPILADLAACRLIAWKHEIVPGLSRYARLVDGCEWFGDEVVPLSPSLRLPQGVAPWGMFGRYLKPFFTAKPVVSSGCIGCKVCEKTCPREAIKIKEGQAIIDNSLCIRCYCCQELCPQGAILLKNSYLAKAILYLVEKKIYRR
jgi:uncharacterized protein (DUF362 family)/Pyruvate/2-oxoacid:ferredoxin oxidoreductase delta subunit